MERSLTSEAVAGICTHMNADHAESIAAYARHYARLDGVVSARIASLDARGMDLAVERETGGTTVRVDFDHELTDAMDARETLVAMAQTAAGAPPAAH